MDNPPDKGGPCEVTITAPDRDWLQAFVRRLVEDGLAAAGHVDMMHTTYRWAGDVHEADEARAVLHTVFRNLAEVHGRLEREHEYEVACLTATAIDGGSPEYLAWIGENSTSSENFYGGGKRAVP